MKDQHKKISGYRDLSQEEIDLMNKGKALANQVGAFIEELEACESVKQDDIAIAKTQLKTGFMWAIRGVAQPGGF